MRILPLLLSLIFVSSSYGQDEATKPAPGPVAAPKSSLGSPEKSKTDRETAGRGDAESPKVQSSLSLEWFKALVPLVQSLFWPTACIVAFVVFRKPMTELFAVLASRMQSGKIEALGVTFEMQVANTKDFEEAVQKRTGEKPTIYGNPDMFELVCKATTSRLMKSTKVMNTPTGCLVQVSTKEIGPTGALSVAEAVTFVPGVNVNITKNNQNKIVDTVLVAVA